MGCSGSGSWRCLERHVGRGEQPLVGGECFLVELYRLSREGQKEFALDLIFQTIDGLLSRWRPGDCDELLRAADPTRLDTTSLVGFLNATLPAAARLLERPAFVAKASERLRALRGDEVAKRLVDRHR